MSYKKTEYWQNADILTPVHFRQCDFCCNEIHPMSRYYRKHDTDICIDCMEEVFYTYIKASPMPDRMFIKMVAAEYKEENGRYVSKEKREVVMQRDEYVCQKCGAKDNLQIDHIFPFSKGGGNNLDNLQVLCQTCNLKKSDKLHE